MKRDKHATGQEFGTGSVVCSPSGIDQSRPSRLNAAEQSVWKAKEEECKLGTRHLSSNDPLAS